MVPRVSRSTALVLILALAISAPLLAMKPAEEGAAAKVRTLATTHDEVALRQSVESLAALDGVSSSDVRLVGEVARAGAVESGRVAAVVVLQQWLQRPDVQADATRELIGIAKASGEVLVRGMAIQAVALENPAPSDEMVRALSDFVVRDSAAANRALAALALGHVKGPLAGNALYALANAYGRESDLATKRSILLEIVRVSGERAPTVLASLPPSSEPLIAQDLRDYTEIIASGVKDANEIYDVKQLRDVERNTVIGMEQPHVD